MTVTSIVAAEARRHCDLVIVARLAACGLGIAAVLLPALSGWFISSAALAGAAGATMAMGFNTLLPSAAIRLLAILRTGCRYAERVTGHDSALRVLACLRPRVFAALAAASLGRVLGVSAGDAVARVTGDVAEVEAGLVLRSGRWTAAAALLAGLAVLWLQGAGAAILVLSAVAVVGIAAVFLARNGAERGETAVLSAGVLKQDATQLLSARAELRAYGLEEWAAAHIAERAAVLAAAQRRVIAFAAAFEMIVMAAGGAAAMGTLSLGAPDALPAAALAALAALATVETAAGWGRGLQRHGHLIAATRRLDELVGIPDVRSEAEAPGPHARIDLPTLGVRLAPGVLLGIHGPSGCGKTTLLETLVGLREAAPGMARLGGTDLAEMPAGAARPLFSLLAQDAPVLAGTVRENLLLARPGATDVELWSSLHCAALNTRVAALPNALDTWLGEAGARLSGGERRRLCLARALLRPAPWLLLDEPTEGLDGATEALVVARLAAWLSATGQGAVIVSHRPAPLTLCHKTVRLDPPCWTATPLAAQAG